MLADMWDMDGGGIIVCSIIGACTAFFVISGIYVMIELHRMKRK